MKLLLAIDGGGTKTDAVLFEPDGNVISRVQEAGCNPNDIGFDGACKVLMRTLDRLLEPYGGPGKCCLLGCFAGLSGGTIGDYRQRFATFFRGLLPGSAFIGNHSDALSALSSCIGHRDGCVLISGTGSVAYARQGGKLLRSGGWGYLLDKGGSGFDFGRDALYYSLCAADGRGADTRLRNLAEERLGRPIGDAVGEIYEKGKPFIASFAPLAFEGLRLGDWAAKAIMERNMREMAKLLNALTAQMDPSPDPCPTGLTGGIFHDFSLMEPFLTPLLDRRHQFIRPQLPPVYGSALEALAGARITPEAGFSARFKEGLERG